MENSRKWFYVNKSRTHSKVNAPDWYDTIESEYIKLMTKKDKLEEQIKIVRSQLIDAMKDEGIKIINTSKSQVSIINSYSGNRVDSGKLKLKYPEIFAECSKSYIMDEHLQITIKGKKKSKKL